MNQHKREAISIVSYVTLFLSFVFLVSVLSDVLSLLQKIEQLQIGIHSLDKPSTAHNKHKIFVDTAEEGMLPRAY